MVRAEGTERIFLYGTLRRGGSRDVQQHYEGVQFISVARVRGELYDLADYPGLRLTPDASWVTGELFDVAPATLALLDEWESIDPNEPELGEYRRVDVVAELESGAQASCWVYEIALRRCEGRLLIQSGDWLAHEAARR